LIHAPFPIPLVDVRRQLVGLAEGEWLAQFEPVHRALWVPEAKRYVPIAGSLPSSAEWRAAVLERLTPLPFPIELGLVGDAELCALDVGLPGSFYYRVQRLLEYEAERGLRPLDISFRFVHSFGDVNRALAATRGRHGSGALLLKRWNATYPISDTASVPWMAALRVSHPIGLQAGVK
jgi:hypothetical protein